MCRGADYVEPAASDVLAAVLAEIRRSLHEAETGQTVDLGSFAQDA